MSKENKTEILVLLAEGEEPDDIAEDLGVDRRLVEQLKADYWPEEELAVC